MKSIFFRPTGKMILNRAEAKALPAHQIVRNNQVFEAQELDDTRGMSIYKRHSNDELDIRLNAVGDTADNATGYQITMDTLTYRIRQITTQKFYQISPADFLPVMVGEGAYSNNLLFNRTYSTSDDFEAGNIRTGTGDARLATANVAIDGVTQSIQDWAKTIGYTTIDVEKAIRANSWDLIMALHEARKLNFDLGIQKIAFLGSVNDTKYPGLFTNPNITVDTGTIPTLIKLMTASQLATFVTTLLAAYLTNVGNTCLPDTFVIPLSDMSGLAALTPGTVGTYPVPIIKYIQEAFDIAIQKSGMVGSGKPLRIIANAYANKANNPNTLNYYMLYRNDPTSLRMNIPVPYTVSQIGTINGFQFHDTAWAEYTGVTVLRNAEVMAFTNAV